LGQGAIARIEMYVDAEKSGKVQRVYLEGNVDPTRVPELGCKPVPPPPPPPPGDK
jgi:hypothetical protein